MPNNLSLNYAATICSDSFYVGGNWGFVLKENPDYNKIVEILKMDGTVKMFEVTNGLIVFCDNNYLYQLVQQVSPDSITQDVLYMLQNRKQVELQELQKFFMSVIQGNSIYGEDKGSYKEYNIGLYCSNTTHKIRLNGKVYPAFAITINEILAELAKVKKHIKVYVNMGNRFENLTSLTQKEDMNILVYNMEVSKTMTGVFLTIRVDNIMR